MCRYSIFFFVIKKKKKAAVFLSVLDTGRFLLQQVLLTVLSRDSLSFAETTRCAGIKLGNEPSQIETGVLRPGSQLHPVDGAVSLSG